MKRRASPRLHPRASRARAAAALSLALAAAAAGCAPQADDLDPRWPEVPASYYLEEEQIRPPGELTAEIMRSADAVADPPFEIRQANAAFAEAVEDYGLFVQRLVTWPAGGTDDQRRTALVLLARALERAPGAGAEALARADRVARAALETPGERGREDMLRALAIASEVLLELVRGPYAAAPDALERVLELQEAVEAASRMDAPLPETTVNQLIRRAEFALKAMLQAPGLVGATYEAPGSP